MKGVNAEGDTYFARTIDTCLLGSAGSVLEYQRPLKQARGRAPKLGQPVRQTTSLAGLHSAGCGMGASVWHGVNPAHCHHGVSRGYDLCSWTLRRYLVTQN